ncbi:DoxX family protein [Chitinophaga filiformis]|uniref:DoxX family protein n=1 Tax=Chitinophaga filiformis TaxID=104663 RepID=A0ABY4HWI5_CHIFI|nr:DoxX family protein [Chitinophaga filiformis]UPK68163.1 DoxX family protein [Chitinophaga filiformis]
MTNQQPSSRALNIVLWIAQVFLAAGFLWAAAMKLLQPIEKLAAMWPWTGEVPSLIVRLLGIIDLLGALGLILPALLRIKPRLTATTALAIIALMICASVFHIVRGEAAAIWFNIFFAAIAAFIAWGRGKK